MKEIKIFVLILLSTCLLVGCEKKEEIEIEGEKIDTKEMVHEHCSRTGTLEGGEAELNYDIYYTGEVLNILRSEEKVKSSTSSILDEYEEAYQSIHSHYKDLAYYDTEVVREDDSVTSIITINYDKVDIEELIRIEGADDNIIENGVAKVQMWKDLAKKVGASCTKVVEDEV